MMTFEANLFRSISPVAAGRLRGRMCWA